MIKQILLIILAAGLLVPAAALGVEKDLRWDPVSGATGYIVYMSIDNGATWNAGTDVGDVTTCTYTGIPDSGLVLFRVSAYNAQSEAIRYEAGAWYNGDWLPPDAPTAIGIK